jgi:hypothetical protein
LCILFGAAASSRADIVGFKGPWAPVDGGGNLINGFAAVVTGPGQSFSGALSPDQLTLTLNFSNPQNSTNSIFFENYVARPAGTVSYDWSVEFFQDATWVFETAVLTSFPGGFGYLTAGTYKGSASIAYPTFVGNYFSYGNIGFGGDGALGARVVLTNFQYVGSAEIPEPGSFLLAAGAVAALAWRQRLRRA